MTHGSLLQGSVWLVSSSRLGVVAGLLPLLLLSKLPSESELPSSIESDAATAADDLTRDLTARFWERVRVFAARRLRDRAAAEDVAQEALRRVLVALRENRVQNTSALPGFVFETAKNVCLHRVRSAVRESRAVSRMHEPEPEDEAPGALARLIAEERRAQVREALNRLDEGDRDILLMQYEEQLSAEEIGSRLGVTAATARVRKHRALQRLGKLLGRPLPGNDPVPEGTQ